MPRPKGSKNKNANKKAAAGGEAAPREAAPMQAATPNVSADDTVDCYNDLEDIDSAIASLGQKKARTIARYENMGVDVPAVRECQKLGKKDDAPDWIRRITTAAAVLRIIPTETGEDGQLSVMPGLSVQAPSPEKDQEMRLIRAKSDGYNTGRHGGEAGACLHQPGTEEHVAWNRAFKVGEKERAEAKELRDAKRDKKKEATRDDSTQLERDTAAYRAGGVAPPVSGNGGGVGMNGAADASAYQAGQTAAKEGLLVSANPHPADSTQAEQWKTGFSDFIWERDGTGQAMGETENQAAA